MEDNRHCFKAEGIDPGTKENLGEGVKLYFQIISYIFKLYLLGWHWCTIL